MTIAMVSSFLRLAAVGSALLFGGPLLAGESIPTAATDGAQLDRGKYIAQLGDCIACHTAPQGELMAGGLELSTPMGTIYSSNITPDPKTGIGAYSFEQFDKAMREGVNAAGQNLYPAMPYPSYAKMTEADMRDLYAYLMHGVPDQSRDDALGEPLPRFARQRLVAHLDEAQAAGQRFLDACEFALDAVLAGVRQRIDRRQREGREDGAVGRQHRRDVRLRADARPFEPAVLDGDDLAAPRRDAEELEPNGGVRVGIDA